VGTKGFCQADRATFTGKTNWRFQGEKNSPYVQEHTDLIASIRAGKPYNELESVIEATLTAIMGRMSAYTGKEVTWEQVLNSQEELVPANLAWDMTLPVPPVAMPGKTELV
jgi:myo-inositol 2-dehydrogenase/D-chiro-inositol 1-dehydrogenase